MHLVDMETNLLAWRRQKVACGHARSTHTRRGNGVAIKDNLGGIILVLYRNNCLILCENRRKGSFSPAAHPYGQANNAPNTVADRSLAVGFRAATMQPVSGYRPEERIRPAHKILTWDSAMICAARAIGTSFLCR